NQAGDASVTDAAAPWDAEVTDDAAPWDAEADAALPPPLALLEIYALDIWAQPLPQGEATLTVTRNSAPVATTGWPVATVALRDAGTYAVSLEAPDHDPLSVDAVWSGGTGLADLSVTPGTGTTGHGFSLTRQTRDVGGEFIPVYTLYLGLRHQWFSAEGRPARRGNQVDFLMDGEEAWGQVYTDLTAATHDVMISTWWWVSSFELYRDPVNHHQQTATERWPYTMLGVLENLTAVRRVLVGEFWGSHDIVDFMTSDADLKAYAETANDDFEIMGQGNPTFGVFQFEVTPFQFGERVRQTFAETAGRTFDPEDDIQSTVPARQVDLTQWPVSVEVQIASYHQKFAVIDGQVAFIGGMNVKGTDWDTSDHRVFEERRMEFDATQAERDDVINKDADSEFGPRKDYMVRLEGPSVQDAADVFHERWAYQISEGVPYSQNSTDFTVPRDQPAQPGGLQVQVTATLPQPFWEHAIAETWYNAVAHAEQYIYIEDQYWRIPMLVDAILDRMTQVPTLRLVVITKPVDEWTDPGCEWTHATHQQLLAAFPNRYRTYQLRAFDIVDVGWGIDETDSKFMDMDTHSKLLIVDDKFLSVGSCNKNNRGIVYEGELNVAVLDPTWVRDVRRRIFANILPDGTPATDDVATWWQQLEDAATWNDNVYDNWDAEGWDIDLGDGTDPLPAAYTPQGFIYSLGFRTVNDCFIEGVGPDMT
ncbi:MAG: hypothetical protein J7M25_04880, partial [Deltaproteobacteria bacterium]|nr:hypothetical protein [Deltaproteobacteria bacterium]